MQQLDSLTAKKQQEQEWNRVAPGWKKHDERLREMTRPVTSRLLDLAGIESGYRVLDVASGTGDPGLPAAEIAGPSRFVLSGSGHVTTVIADVPTAYLNAELRNLKSPRTQKAQCSIHIRGAMKDYPCPAFTL